MDSLEWQGEAASCSVVELLWWAILPSPSELELLRMYAVVNGRGSLMDQINAEVVRSIQLPGPKQCAALLEDVGHTPASVICTIASRLWEFKAHGNDALFRNALQLLRANSTKILHAYQQLLLHLQKLCWWTATHEPTASTHDTRKRKRGVTAAARKQVCNQKCDRVCPACKDVLAVFVGARVMSVQGQICADEFFFGTAIGLDPEKTLKHRHTMNAAAKLVHVYHLAESVGVKSVTEIEAVNARAKTLGIMAINFLIMSKGQMDSRKISTPREILAPLRNPEVERDPAFAWTLALMTALADASMLTFYTGDDGAGMWRWQWRMGPVEDAKEDDKHIFPRLLATAWVANASPNPPPEMPACCRMMCAAADTAIHQADLCTLGVLSYTSSLCCATMLQNRLQAVQRNEACANHIVQRLCNEYAVTFLEDEATSTISRRRMERLALQKWRTGAAAQLSILTAGAGAILSALGVWLGHPLEESARPATETDSKCDCLVMSAHPARDLPLKGCSSGPLVIPFAHTTVRMTAQSFRGAEAPTDASTDKCAHDNSLQGLQRMPWRYQAVAASFAEGFTVDAGVSAIHRARCCSRLSPRDAVVQLELPQWEFEQLKCARELPLLFPQLMLELFLGDFDGNCAVVYDLKATQARARAVVHAAATSHRPTVYVGICRDIICSRAVTRAINEVLGTVRCVLFPGWFVGLIVCAGDDE